MQNGLIKDRKMKSEFKVYQAGICVDDGHINQTFVQNPVDHFASAEYRDHLVEVYLKKALEAVRQLLKFFG